MASPKDRTEEITRRLVLSGAAALPGSLAACALPGVGAAPNTQEAAGPAVQAPPAGAAAPQTAPAATGPAAAQEVLAPTPECADDDDVTPAQTEGPYFTPNSPQRSSLVEPGMQGTRLALTGRVLTTDCKPVARALIDVWQADDAGAYDNRGYKLRGHLFTDEQGAYRMQTILPGLYPGRTRHIHVKVQAPNQPVLTTQLYFPNEPRNRQDGIFHPELVLDVRDDASGKVGLFDFVLRLR